MSNATGPVDLTNCDREPIHQLGSVQPFGFLLAVSSDWIVTRASANLAEFLGITHSEAAGRPVSSIIGPEALHALRNKLADLSRKYDLFADMMDRYIPAIDGPVDLEQLFNRVPEPVLRALHVAARTAWSVGTTVSAGVERLRKKL